MEPPICSDYGGAYFTQWGEMAKKGEFIGRGYERQMITDISLVGGFLENIPQRRAMHAPYWHEPPDIEGVPADQWMARERQNPEWTQTESPFDLPHILRWHIGRTRYELRRELFEALCQDNTRPLLGIGE